MRPDRSQLESHRILPHLELNTSTQVRNHNIVHARVRRPLRRPADKAKMISEQDIADNHLHGVVSKESSRAHDLAVTEVEVVFAGSSEF